MPDCFVTVPPPARTVKRRLPSVDVQPVQTAVGDLGWYRDSSCPGSGLDNTAHYAQYIAADPIGTTLRACTSSAIPTGWFASGAGFYTSSCQITPGGLPPNTVWIKRLY